MNYHNFASRLSIQRPSTPTSANTQPKATPKKSLRPARRRLAAVAALALLSFCLLLADAGAQPDAGRPNTPPAHPINTPTFIITLTGLGVALLRLPALWRHDLDC